MVAVNSWGRLSAEEHKLSFLTDRKKVGSVLEKTIPGLPYGMGRSYGDVCLNPGGHLWNTRQLDRFIGFDESSGRLLCESGVLLRDIQRLTMPRGWILPVTPGTQMLTVGGAIANDVHGKNHHVRGTFGEHVIRMTLQRTNGDLIECGPDSNPEWFSATVGGLGLTGVILAAELQLCRVKGPWLLTETIPYRNLEEFFQISNESEADWEHTVSWFDCVSNSDGRGIFMRGNSTYIENTTKSRSKSLSMPFVPPISMVNRWTLFPFNQAYYNVMRWNSGKAIVHYEPFFYPLDNLQNWNRMYGPKGFFQYQSVVPTENAKDATRSMMKAISQSGEGSFLAALKTFGRRDSIGMLSFPEPGVTLALDFPNRGLATERLFQHLDSIVSEAKGRIYMAKDTRMPRAMFEAGYPRFNEFSKYRDHGISSAMSRRLMGS